MRVQAFPGMARLNKARHLLVPFGDCRDAVLEIPDGKGTVFLTAISPFA